jgi:hypothetical protein
MTLYMLPINKIYLDSRHRTQSSESDTDFEIQLKQTINLPENCTCVVSDVMLKNTITTIERFNENVYVRANNVDKIIKLDNRIYNIRDFGDHLTYRMNLAFMPVPGAFTPGLFQFLEDVYNSVVLIVPTNTNTLRIFTDEELKLDSINWTGEWFDKSNPRSANSVLNNYGTSKTYTNRLPYKSNPISLQPLDYVLLNAYGLGNTSYGSREGERHIIKKIPLSSYGETTVMSYFDVSDYTPANKISLTRLKFTVTDPFGNIVDLHGGNVSFSLLFISND